MAFAPAHTYFDQDATIVGCFREKQHGNLFEFSMNDEGILSYAPEHYPHKVWVTNPLDGIDQGFRYAIVRKTLAHVIVDEDEGGLVVETWKIKGRREYPKPLNQEGELMAMERTYGMAGFGEPMPQTIEEWHHLTDLGEVVMRRQLKEIGELKSKVASLSQKVASQKARLDKG